MPAAARQRDHLVGGIDRGTVEDLLPTASSSSSFSRVEAEVSMLTVKAAVPAARLWILK